MISFLKMIRSGCLIYPLCPPVMINFFAVDGDEIVSYVLDGDAYALLMPQDDILISVPDSYAVFRAA